MIDLGVRTVSVEVVVDDRDSLGFRAGGVHVHIPGQMVFGILFSRLALCFFGSEGSGLQARCFNH